MLGSTPGSPPPGAAPSGDVTNFEIDPMELSLFQQIGRGTYGLVQKGKWRDLDVAVKTISNEMEKRAFIVEVHLLHNAPHIAYTTDHALSWVQQTANAVAYLHSLRLVHRDLKPPNLLLTDHFRLLKICDFGTVADLKTTMTNNRGSAAWMAPEVFDGTKYDAKCDVYSLGIIIHEIFTRKKPFEELGGPAYRIMWKVHEGIRPPPIAGVPRAMADLMTSCWLKEPQQRPAMQQVFEMISELVQLYPRGQEPLYDSQTNRPLNSTRPSTASISTPSQTKALSASPVPVRQIPAPPSTPYIDVGCECRTHCVLQESLESLSSSSGIVNPFDPGEPPGRAPKGHRRGGSYETAFLTVNQQNGGSGLPVPMVRRSSSSAMDRPMAIQSRRNAYTTNDSAFYDTSNNDFLQMIDADLRPSTQVLNCPESMQMNAVHLTVCKDIVEIDRAIARKLEQKHDLIAHITRLLEYEKLLKRRDQLISVKKDAELRISARRRAYPQLDRDMGL